MKPNNKPQEMGNEKNFQKRVRWSTALNVRRMTVSMEMASK